MKWDGGSPDSPRARIRRWRLWGRGRWSGGDEVNGAMTTGTVSNGMGQKARAG
jgi:hypothetical protein